MVEWGKAITNVARREGLGEVLEGRPLPEVSHCMWNRYRQPAPEGAEALEAEEPRDKARRLLMNAKADQEDQRDRQLFNAKTYEAHNKLYSILRESLMLHHKDYIETLEAGCMHKTTNADGALVDMSNSFDGPKAFKLTMTYLASVVNNTASAKAWQDRFVALMSKDAKLPAAAPGQVLLNAFKELNLVKRHHAHAKLDNEQMYYIIKQYGCRRTWTRRSCKRGRTATGP